MYVEPETVFFVEHWATSHGSCPAICSEPLAESCTFYLADHTMEIVEEKVKRAFLSGLFRDEV